MIRKQLKGVTFVLLMACLLPQGVYAQQLASAKSMKCHLSERQENRDKSRTACIYKCPNGKKEREVIPKGASCPGYLDVGS
ncbi:MAG TPA: hypothetical protein DIT38_10030 [Burkholderiales bacterium]|jgi:hypothetical protein|nr:hypothetical protein [Burkholderiaceae bacterium]HCO58494.1 hypothetical protein [Burkholderiales bacterium]